MLIFIGLTLCSLNAQETRFFMPSEIKQAYENGTRSYNGKPSVGYWQNTVDYNIKVTIIPSERLIEGHEEVIYHNSSPNEINMLVVRLYADVYKKGNLRGSFFGRNIIDTADIHDGVELKDVVIDGVSYDLNNEELTQRTGTNIIFNLDEPLKPGEDLSFKATWIQKIPLTKIRMGAYDSTTFFVAQWYPQIAVYDDIFGWDELNYIITSEFYNNLGNYDVKITTPNEFLVWATGTLENPREILPDEIYDRYANALNSDSVINIVTASDLNNGMNTLHNTWHFTASEVSDFAFALSDHYLWDAAIQPVADRQVFISSVFPTDTTDDYSGHVALQQKIMKHFSEDIPGIAYPYEAFTTFIRSGSSGMEYPMMANNGGAYRGITMHEMFHTYFPMYVRINEKRWAWMDEGWANFISALVTNRFFEDDFDVAKVFPNVAMYGNMGSIADLPLITSSQFLKGFNYDFASYSKPSMLYATLYQYLGEELFLKCYQQYIVRWAKKSPTPYDFFYTFEDVSGQDLSWLWKSWFFEFGVADIAIESTKKDKVKVLKKGNLAVPLFIDINYKNGEAERIVKNAGIWADGRNEYQVSIPNFKHVENIFVNTVIADANILDNVFPSIGSLYENIELSEDILGKYITDDYPVKINITKIEGLLYFKIPEYEISVIIYPQDSDNFRSLDNTWNVLFKTDDSGQYKSMNIVVNGYEHTATKSD